MIGSLESRIAQRSIVAIDAVVVVWTIVWIALGITVGTFVGRLSAVGEGVSDAGRAVGRAGDAIADLSDVPLIGGGFAELSSEITGMGRETVERGRSIEDDVDRLALLIGASIALAPTLPVLAIWGPPRISRERERHALRTSLRRGDDVALAFLAHRAVATRLFRELRTVSDDPVGDLAAGRYEALASLELQHLGLRASSRLARTGETRSLARR